MRLMSVCAQRTLTEFSGRNLVAAITNLNVSASLTVLEMSTTL